MSCKSANINFYQIKYVKMKSLDYVNTDSENPLYLGDGCSNGDKYLIFTSTNQNEKISEK